MYNKEWHKQYYKLNKEKIKIYNKNKYSETHNIKSWNFSEEKFQEIIKEKYGDDLKTLSPYINFKEEIKVKCNKCESEWISKGYYLLRGQGCKQCSILKQRKNKQKFVEEFTINYGDKYELLSEYINAKTKIKLKCKECGYIWDVRPTHLTYSKSGCPICANKDNGLKQRKTHDEFVDEISNKFGNKYTVIGQYIKANTKILIRCNTCNNNWDIFPYSILQGVGCPICNQSKGECVIKEYLENNNIQYKQQYAFDDCYNKNPLHFDFYLPFQNICIEYDGVQHFKSIKYFGGEDKLQYIKKNDEIKNIYCKTNKIQLIRIPYTQINEISNILNKKVF